MVGGSMPRRLQEETRRYLECGQLRFGFLEVRSEECRRLELVAFSCKGRGWSHPHEDVLVEGVLERGDEEHRGIREVDDG